MFPSHDRGEEKDDIHLELKSKFLAPIFERDDPQNYGAMLVALRALYRNGVKELAKDLQKHTVRLTSTTTATPKQFTEYLEEVERYGVKLGADMSKPSNLDYERY